MNEDYKKDMYFCYSKGMNDELKRLGINPCFKGFSLKGKSVCIYRKTDRLGKLLDSGLLP